MLRCRTLRRLIGLLTVCLLLSPVAFADSSRVFDDEDLTSLLQHTSRGVIYLWSPHMPYSVQGATEAQRVVREMGLTSVLLLDPYADPTLATRELRSVRLPGSALRRMHAQSLAGMGATQHFPTAVVFQRGQLDVQMLPGYTPPGDLRAYIRERLNNF